MVNNQAFWAGYLLSDGNDPLAVAQRLGVSAEDLAEVMGGFSPPVLQPGCVMLSVGMAAKHRTLIAREAMYRGIEMTDLVSRAVTTTARDNLFAAVLDG